MEETHTYTVTFKITGRITPEALEKVLRGLEKSPKVDSLGKYINIVKKRPRGRPAVVRDAVLQELENARSPLPVYKLAMRVNKDRNSVVSVIGKLLAVGYIEAVKEDHWKAKRYYLTPSYHEDLKRGTLKFPR